MTPRFVEITDAGPVTNMPPGDVDTVIPTELPRFNAIDFDPGPDGYFFGLLIVEDVVETNR